MARHLGWCLMLIGLMSAGASAQWFDFYPNATGDHASWTDANNWVRYNNDDLNLYPPYPSQSYYSGVYPNKTGPITQVAYVRDQASATIAAGTSINMGSVRVGDPYYYDNGHPLLARTGSTLTVGGTLTCEQYLVAGGVYPGLIVQKAGARVTVPEFRVGFAEDYMSTAASSTYRMEGGYLAGARSELGHMGGVGVFEQTGGTAKFNWLNLGYSDSGGAGTGIYNLYGGTASPYMFALGSTTYMATGYLNLLGGVVRFDATDPTPGGSFTISRGGVKLGEDFHCDVTGSSDDCYYSQGALGSLTVELKNAAEFGYMSVARGVSLAGTFQAIVAPGASWIIGDAFEVLRSRNNTISATQAFLDSYNLLADRYFNISIDADGLILTAIKAAGGTIQPHPGDANNDGAVNVGDLGILALNWNGTGKTWATGDFTGEGAVNVGDLGVLALNWGWTGAPAGQGIPEPASLVLLGLGALAMLRRRHS